MAHNNHDAVLPQDTDFDNDDQPGIAQPYTQSEIEDLLYGTDRPASERLAALQDMRNENAIRESGDWGGQDPAAMLDEIDRAIEELSAIMANADDLDDEYPGLETGLDTNDRLDTLSPDDVDAIDAIENGDELDEEDDDLNEEDNLDEEDDEDDIGPLDESEWTEDDDFDPEQGVR